MGATVAFVNDIAAVWWPLFFTMTWQSSLAAGVILLVLLIARRWPSPLRYGLALVALVRFAFPPVVALPMTPFAWITAEIPAISAGVTPRPVPRPSPLPQRRPVAGDAARETRAAVEVADPVLSLRAILLLIHLVGCLGTSLWIAYNMLALRRMAAGAEDVAEHVQVLIARLSEQLGLRKQPRVLAGDSCDAPAAFGLLRPTVMIPGSMQERMHPAHLRLVLAHELVHHRRGDLWVNWLQVALVTFWWFNPVFHLLTHMVRSIREDCCDDWLLAAGLTDGRSYCETLLSTAELLSANSLVRQALGFADRLHPVGRRLTRIMDRSLPRPERLSWAPRAALGLFACLLLPSGAAVSAAPERAWLHSEDRRLDEELGALTRLEVGQHWPAYVLFQVEQATGHDGIELSRVEILRNTAAIAGTADDTGAVAAVIEDLERAPLMQPMLRTTRRFDGGSYQFEIELSPLFEAPSGGRDQVPFSTDLEELRRSVHRRQERKEEALARIPLRTEAAGVARQIKGCIGRSGAELIRFQPAPIRDAGLYEAWELQVQIAGSAAVITRAVVSLARLDIPLVIDGLVVEFRSNRHTTVSFALTTVLRSGAEAVGTLAEHDRISGREEQLLAALETMRQVLEPAH